MIDRRYLRLGEFAQTQIEKHRQRAWRRYTLTAALSLIFISCVPVVMRAQPRTSSTTARHGFNIMGDIKVDECQGANKTLTLDVILVTSGNQVFARQKSGLTGRYRFMDVYEGEYNIVIEIENVERLREPILISATSPTEIQKDLSLACLSTPTRDGAGVVSADAYKRSSANSALYQKASKAIEGKDNPLAISTLLQLVASDPNDYAAWSDLGMLYFIQKDFESAENSYAKALAAKPGIFAATLNLGRVQLARKNYEQAIESLEAAVKLDPKSASANYFLGEAYLQVKKGSKAVVYLNEALKLDPSGMADAHLRLGALYNGAGMKDKAVAEYEQFLKKKPDYPDKAKLEKYIADNKKQP